MIGWTRLISNLFVQGYRPTAFSKVCLLNWLLSVTDVVVFE